MKLLLCREKFCNCALLNCMVCGSEGRNMVFEVVHTLLEFYARNHRHGTSLQHVGCFGELKDCWCLPLV